MALSSIDDMLTSEPDIASAVTLATSNALKSEFLRTTIKLCEALIGLNNMTECTQESTGLVYVQDHLLTSE